MEFLAAAIQYDCIPLKKEENLAALTRMIRDFLNGPAFSTVAEAQGVEQ